MKKRQDTSNNEILLRMHRELRHFVPDIPESLERLDPILRMLLQLYSSKLADIDERIDEVWDVATSSLIKSMFPESKRWPVPSFTVIRGDLTDPVVEVDQHTQFLYSCDFSSFSVVPSLSRTLKS